MKNLIGVLKELTVVEWAIIACIVVIIGTIVYGHLFAGATYY